MRCRDFLSEELIQPEYIIDNYPNLQHTGKARKRKIGFFDDPHNTADTLESGK